MKAFQDDRLIRTVRDSTRSVPFATLKPLRPFAHRRCPGLCFDSYFDDWIPCCISSRFGIGPTDVIVVRYVAIFLRSGLRTVWFGADRLREPSNPPEGYEGEASSPHFSAQFVIEKKTTFGVSVQSSENACRTVPRGRSAYASVCMLLES